MHNGRDMVQCRCLVGWWLLVAAVVIVTTAQTTAPSIILWATSTSGGALTIRWTVSAVWQSSNSLNDIEHFRVFVNGHEKVAVSDEVISYDVSGLTNNTAYNIQVKGTLVNTSSADPLYSDVISATTLDCTAPRPPDTPKKLDVSGGFVQVSVQQPTDTGGVGLLSVTVIVRHPDSLTLAMQQSQTPVNSGALTYNIYGLDAQTNYRISALTINEGGLKSLESDFLDITTKSLQLPGPCPSPKVLNTTGASVTLQLVPPLDDGGGRIQGFNVYLATDGAGSFEEVASTIDTGMIDVAEVLRLSKLHDRPLLPETKYIFKAVAVNLADICISIANSLQVANATEVWTTVASLPGPPPSPCFMKATGSMISMSLMKPTNMQGTKCTGFSIIVKDNTGKMIENSIDASDDTTYDATSLQANTNYTISTAVITNMGTTSYSSSTTMNTTNPTSPTQPLAVTAMNITGSSAVMEWSFPVDNGGLNISGYTLILISQGIEEERPAVSSPWLLKDLTADTVYTIKVKAINMAERKSVSSVGYTFKTTSPSKPSEPSSISSVFASGGAIEVAWNPPESRGGEPLSSLGYHITAFTSSSCFDSKARTCLECNAVKISAQHYKLVENASVCVRPSEAECPDGSMNCCICHEDGVGFSCGLMSQVIPPRSVVGTTSTVIKGLNYSSPYYLGVQAINRAGKSTMSTLQLLQTTIQNAPSFPSNIRQLNATGGSIQLTWDAPLDTGGGPILGYRVYRNLELRTVGYVMPPYTDCGGMLAGSAYAYGITAVNGSLVEGAMASTTLTTGSLSIPLQPLLSLTAAMYNRLQFSANSACDTGGELLRYQYEVKYNGTVVATDYFECCNFGVGNLMKDRTYTVALRVINSMAVSPWTESKFATTSGNPSVPVPSLIRVNTYSAVVSLGASSTDKETHSYDVYLYLNQAETQHHVVSCQEDVVVGLYVCPTSFRVETLTPQTEYGIKVTANGGIGSVSSILVNFTTSSIATGVFGMSKRDYYADKGGSISTAVLRTGGTSGSVDVGVNVIEPETVLVQCEHVVSGGCHCTLYLRSSGRASDPCTLAFIDGQDSAEVSFSTWNDESAELIPFPVVVVPFGVTLSGEHAALLHNDEYQQSGFVSFSSSPIKVLENSLYATVDVVRLNGSIGTVSAGFESFDISAVAGIDYISSSGTVTMVEQQSVAQIWVQLIDNHASNVDKSFGIRLMNQPMPLGAEVLVAQQVIILDDESSLNAVPHKMGSAIIVYSTGGEFEIEWANASNEIAPVLGYLIRITPVNPGNVSSLFNTTQLRFTLSGLSARNAYRVEIAGWNSVGMGEFSGIVEVATQDISPPGPPLALAVSDVTNINFTLTWEPPRDNGGSVVNGYWVVISGDTDNVTLSKFVETDKLLLVVKGLRASSSYTCNVSTTTATFPDSPAAISSAQIIVLTATGVVPGEPRAVALVEQPRGGTLTFFLMRPQYTGGLILQRATLYLRKEGTDPNTAFTPRCRIDLSDQNNSTCTINNLVASTSYEVYATFSNAKGESAPGESKTFQTNSAVDLPSFPLNLRATNVTAGNIKLEWDIPADLSGASDVVGYIVYQKIAVAGAAYFTLYDGQDSKERSFVARGLMRDSTYAFAVVALNDASFCADPSLYNRSSFFEVTTLSSSRVEPARDLFVLYKTGGSITLGWKAPDDLAGLPLLEYVVELESPTNGYEVLTDSLSSNQTNYTHYGLSENTTYSYVVTAVNEDGPSRRSAVFTAATTSVSMPDPVQNVNYVNVSGGSITLVWDAPLDTGGHRIERYEISRPGRSFYSTTTVFEDHFSLSVVTEYIYTVSAFNGYYRGYSASVWASTGDPSLPDPPQMNAIPFGGRLEVSWEKPENTGGVPISRYLIMLFIVDATTAIENTPTLSLSYTFWGLLARTHYRLAGKTFTDFGGSVLVEYDVVTGPPDAPSAPQQPTVSNIQGGRVDIHAERPKYTGGEAVSLILYMNGEVKHSFPPEGGGITIYGLVAETEYLFKVSAKNTVAETKSAAFKITTTSISTPGQTQNLQIVSVTYSQMNLTWDNLQDTGGDNNLQYKVIYVKCSSDGTPTESEQFQIFNNNTVTVDKLDYSSFYNVSVIALTTTSLLGKASSSILVETQHPLEGVIIAGSPKVTVKENAEFVSIPVERVGGSFGTISYSYIVTDETAIEGVNYVFTVAIIIELDTNIQSDIIDIPILNDDVYNPGITFLVTIADLNTGRETSTRVIVEDDGDAGFISFTQTSLALLENSAIASLDVIRTGGSSPSADILFVVDYNASSVDRFHLPDSMIRFDVGDTQKTISVQIVNDIEFQLVPDSIAIGFKIFNGGVLPGGLSIMTLTALDDGDISLPKECMNLRQVSTTGGALGLEWTQPVDRGGAGIPLSFLVTVTTTNQAAITQYSEAESTVVYGLSQRTSYQVLVQAKNSAGVGVGSTPLLLSTTSATAPTEPLKIQLVSASSSSIQLTWQAPLDEGGSPIVAYTVYKVATTASTTSRSTFSSISCQEMTICSIKQLQALTNYSIQIQASSAFVTQGAFSDVVTFSTTTPDYPDPPPIANITWVSAGALTIQMFDPVNVGGSNIQEYLLYIRADHDPEFALIYSGALNEHTVYHLRYQTAYHIKYQVVNSVGPSFDSPIKIYKTLLKSLPSAPLNVGAVNKTGGAVTLSWDEPLDIGGRQITGYTIKIVSINGTSAMVIGYDGKSIPSRQGTVYGLTADTEYGMQVVAYLEVSNCFEAALQSWSSVLQVTTTNATFPGSAPELLVGHYTGGIIQLVWIAPKDQGGVSLTGYVLNLVDDTGNSSVLFLTANATIRSFVHNDLTASTKYSYTISTSNSAGSSPTSPVLTVTTDTVTFSSAPLNVQQLTYTTGGAITIGWDRSVDTGGQPIAGYVVYRNSVAVSSTLPPTARSYVNNDGLSASSSYTYTVRTVAQNLMVSMASNDCLAKTTEATKPQKAQSVSAVPGSSYLNMSWVPDGDTGGLPILSFDAKLMLGSTVVESVNLKSDRSYLFTGLTANTTYSGYLKVNNDKGASEELSAKLTTANMSVPSAPEMPSVRSIFGGNFTVQIQPPRFTGGSPITSMKVYEYIGEAPRLKVTLNVSGTQASYTFYGVSASSKYFVSCSAINLAGEGPLSAITTIATTPMNQPGPILTAPSFVGATGTSLSFLWSPPEDTGGSQTLTYIVRVANGTMDAINPTTEFSYTAKQLSYGSSYDLYVRAKNNIGEGTWSPITTATTQPDAAGEFNFAQTSAPILENATQVALVVQRTSGLSGRITLIYSAEKSGAQPATIGSDYAVVRGSSTTTGTIVFESLQREASIVIFIIDDPDYDPDETFTVRITSLTSASVGTPVIGSKNATVVTIVDDGDAGYISFEKPAYSFPEDARTGTVVIIREYGKSTSITLTFEFWGGTATPDVDYRKTTTPVVMDNGVTKAMLIFSIINDKIFEYPDEYFFIRMSVTGGAILRQPLVRVTIVDDGDVSNPGTCPPLELQVVTGGLVTFLARLPDHNGSATGFLTNYIVRLSTETTSIDFNMSATRILLIGNLTASTAYSVIVAPSSPYGQGIFSNSTQFSTTGPSLPGAISSMSMQSRTGGQISLTWPPPADTGGVPITKYRVDVIGFPELTVEKEQPTTEATMYGLAASTSYSFSVQAQNAVRDSDGWGTKSSPFKFSTSVATQPGSLVLSPDPYQDATGGKVYLSWKPPRDTGGLHISSYGIFARSFSRPWFLSATASPNSNPLFSAVEMLNASTAYEFFVLANNSVPAGNLPGKLSIAEGSTQLSSSSNLASWLSVGTVITVEDSVFVVNNLSSVATGSIGLKYPHMSTSILSKTGAITGQATNFAVLNTDIPSLPDLPPVPELSLTTGGMINLALRSPKDTGGIPILDFVLYWNGVKLDSESYVKITSKMNPLQLTARVFVSRLASATSYNVSALALNSLSLCNFGSVTTGPNGSFTTTTVTAPEPPQLATYRITGGGITMTIVDPRDTGGNDIQLYQLYYKRNGTTDPWERIYNDRQHQVVVARLKNATEYAFLASVNNGVFDSANSSVKVVRTLNKSPPGSCESPTLVNSTGGMLQVKWKFPADDGGSTVTGFYATVSSHVDGSGRTTVKTNTTSCSFYRLLADSSYDVVVRVENSNGVGPESAIVTFNTTSVTPPVGHVEVIVHSTTGGAAQISFDEPIDLGGVTSKDMIYSIYLDRDNTINMSYSSLEDNTLSAGSSTRRLTESSIHRRLEASRVFSNVMVGDMDPETLYGIQILPISTFASGGISPSFPVETVKATIPGAPVSLTRDALTGGAVSISWGAPVDTGGMALNPYTLNLSTTSTTGPFTNIYTGLPRTTSIHNLTASSKYWVRVSAWNDIGESPPSAVLEFSTRRITAPTAPENFRILSVSHDAIECAWDLPKDTGGDAINGYTVTATTGNPAVLLNFSVTTLPPTLSATLTALNASTSYSVSVTATNSIGDSGPRSLARYARTSPGANIPSTPQIGCVSHDWVQLLWYPSPGASTYHVMRGGTEIGTTTTVYFTDHVSLVTATSYAIWVASASLASSEVSVTTLDPTDATDAICQGKMGHISQVNYANKVKKQWKISPVASYSGITLTFSTFQLECDHDYVEIIDASTNERLWKGGCVRTGHFVYQVNSSVIVSFTSDNSVTAKGFEMKYEIDGSMENTVIPPPGNGVICSGHGRSQIDGSCKCSVGFTGEGCNNRVVCCSDPHQCHHAVCDMDPAKVIVVSREFGDDDQGTGAMMNAGDKGTASKAVKTLSRAVALSQEGSVILVYPGTYSGLNNRNLEVVSTNLTFSSLKGPFWTCIDCEKSSRFLLATASSTTVEGFTLQNCVEADGGSFKILGKDFSGINLNVVNSTASHNGGVLHATNSKITLNQVAIVNSFANSDAGAIYLEDSQAIMIESNVTKSTAIRGGAMALRGTCSLSMINSKFFGNVASESGGGAYVKGTTTLVGVVLDNNGAPSGGGLAMESGVLIMENCVVSNNKAVRAGGGVTLSEGSTLTATATSIHSNKVQATGGGVYATGTVSIIFDKQEISPSHITGNTALNGAGMYISASHASLQGLDVKNGHADESGGGIAMVDSTVEWLSITIQNNEAVEGGGLVLKNSQLKCKGAVLLTENKASNGGAIWVSTSIMSGVEGTHCLSNTGTANGGALFVDGVSTVENVKQELNKAVRGACMYVENAQLRLVNSKSIRCTASVAGGGLWVTNSEITVREVSLVDDAAPEGGGVFAIASSVSGDMTIDSCVADIRGGGMYLTGKATVVGLNVDGCKAKEGGAAYAVNSILTIQASKLSNSHASEKGGGLYAADSTLVLTGASIFKSTSDLKGGGAYFESSTVVHDGVIVEQCNSTTGGGLYLTTSTIAAKTSTSSSQIAANNANKGGNVFLSGLCSIKQVVISSGIADSGGGIAIDSNSATIEGCSIANNSATFGGGVSLQSGSVCTMKNSVVSQNVAKTRGGGIEILDATLWHDAISMVANTAASGGGVYVKGKSSLLRQMDTFSQVLFQHNIATTGNGGGMHITEQSQVKANGLALVGGSADQGAGVFVNSSTFELKDSSFQNGNASKGGGIFAIHISDVKLTNCSFVKNNASQMGGGIGSDGGQLGTVSLSMDNCTLSGNYAGQGGGIMLLQTNIIGWNTIVEENSAIFGGGVAVLARSSVTLNNWDFTNNTVLKNQLDARGGSLYILVSVVTLTDSVLVSNEKATLALCGGLIYAENSDTRLNIINSVLRFGQAYSGGLIFSSNAHVRLKNATLHRGFAYDFGAGILAVNTVLDISDSFFYDNFAFYDGGGIYMKEGGKLTVSNSFFDLNSVQDRGGAVFLSPGAATTSTISGSNFTRNTNIGYGSTIFVGRKNTVQLLDCIISGNGGPSTEGGALNAIDATVGIQTSLFELNTAIKGAAIHISRSSNATIENSTIRNNTAIVQGGALHASIQATAILTNSTIEGNKAVEGGAVFAFGSAVITLGNTMCRYNTASSFGGAVAMKGNGVITIGASVFEKNKAHTGGGISIQNNASLSVTKSRFQDNNVSDFGGGIYIDKDAEENTTLVHCEALTFGGNTAVAGKDVHWVYYPWFLFNCIDCTSLTGDEKPFIATSATDISAGWWPANVTSGVSLGVELPMNMSTTTTSESATDTAVSRNSSLIKPKSSVLWPTVVVRDYYGAIATYDNVTRCFASPAGTVEGRFSFLPPTWITVDDGYIVFEGAKVFSKFSDEPYPLYINCTLSPVLQKSITTNVLVNKCNPGYENINGQCLPCSKGTYSLDGERCYLCPAGATCEQKDQRGTTIGVVSPLRQQGYFVSKARLTYTASNCDAPVLWPDDDPCKAIKEDDITSRIHDCANASLEVFYKHWSRGRIYACLSGNEYYACDTNTACKEASTPSSSPAVSISTAATQSSSQCAAGYSGIVCATCGDGYYKASNGSCTQCTDPNDPAVERTTRILALVPIVVAIAALLFLCYLFSSVGEQHIVKHAQAASRFDIYTGESQVRLALQAAKADVQKRVRSMMQNVAKRAKFKEKETGKISCGIKPWEVAWRPEKFKIMLGFFQVVGSFKEVYEIPWPHTMSRLMDICSLADFNFVSTTAAECLFKRDYFANYRLSLFALCGMLVLVFLVTLWGILRYRVKLSTLPRHCVACGLPVFTLEHRPPPALAHRRATLVAELRRNLKRKESATINSAGKWNLIARLKTLWATRRRTMENTESSRIVRIVVAVLNWVDRVTQLPASISTHNPRCPTSQRIRNDVLNMVVHSNLRLWRARVWMRIYYKAYQNRCIKLFFWILLLFYPMLCQRVIGMFYCDEIGDHYYMTLDRSNLCYEGTWLFYLPLGITLVVFWVIGVPLLFWVIIFMKRSRGVSDTLLLIRDPSQVALKKRLLLKMRLNIADHGERLDDKQLKDHETELLARFLCDRNLNEPSTVAQVGFIYHSYDTHFWWFEVWDLGRKLLLNCIITLLAKAGANRIICGLVVLLVYLSVMLFCKPYKEPSDSALAGVVQIQLFITLFCGLILKMGLLYLDERVIILVTNAAIVTTAMTLVYAVFSILNEKPRKAQRRSREDQRRADVAHVRKLWRMAYGYALTEIYLDNPNAGPMPLLVMTELARRAREERRQQELNAQLDLTSVLNPLPSADDNQATMLSASQINVIEEEADECWIDEDRR